MLAFSSLPFASLLFSSLLFWSVLFAAHQNKPHQATTTSKVPNEATKQKKMANLSFLFILRPLPATAYLPASLPRTPQPVLSPSQTSPRPTPPHTHSSNDILVSISLFFSSPKTYTITRIKNYRGKYISWRKDQVFYIKCNIPGARSPNKYAGSFNCATFIN